MCLNDNVNLIKAAKIVNDMPVNPFVKREVLKKIVNDEADINFKKIDASKTNLTRHDAVIIDKVNRIIDVIPQELSVSRTKKLIPQQIQIERKDFSIPETFIYEDGLAVISTPQTVYTYSNGGGSNTPALTVTETETALKPETNFLPLILIAGAIYFLIK